MTKTAILALVAATIAAPASAACPMPGGAKITLADPDRRLKAPKDGEPLSGLQSSQRLR